MSGSVRTTLTTVQCLELDQPTMQAILLTEVFSRFRGRKTAIRLSRRFEDLCVRVSPLRPDI